MIYVKFLRSGRYGWWRSGVVHWNQFWTLCWQTLLLPKLGVYTYYSSLSLFLLCLFFFAKHCCVSILVVHFILGFFWLFFLLHTHIAITNGWSLRSMLAFLFLRWILLYGFQTFNALFLHSKISLFSIYPYRRNVMSTLNCLNALLDVPQLLLPSSQVGCERINLFLEILNLSPYTIKISGFLNIFAIFESI